MRPVRFLRPSDEPSVAVAQLTRWLEADSPEPLLIATSGSTGEPKRVVLSRDAVIASVGASARRVGATGQWVLALPSSYVAGVQVIVRSLVAGHQPVVVGGLDLASAMGEGNDAPRFLSLVPTQLHRLVDDPAQAAAVARCHTVLLGGGPIDAGLRQRAEAAGIRVVATYGTSETCGGCVYDGCRSTASAVAVGADGRIRIGGPMLFAGYDGDPELDRRGARRRLVPDLRRGPARRGRPAAGAGAARRRRGQRRGQRADCPRSQRGCANTPTWSSRSRWSACRTRSGATRVVAFVVGAAPRTPLASGSPRRTRGRGHPAQSSSVDALPLLPNGKVDRVALRAGL